MLDGTASKVWQWHDSNQQQKCKYRSQSETGTSIWLSRSDRVAEGGGSMEPPGFRHVYYKYKKWEWLPQLEPPWTCSLLWAWVWYSVAWSSVTFWWQSLAFNWSIFYVCTRSGSPYNSMRSSSRFCTDILSYTAVWMLLRSAWRSAQMLWPPRRDGCMQAGSQPASGFPWDTGSARSHPQHNRDIDQVYIHQSSVILCSN